MDLGRRTAGCILSLAEWMGCRYTYRPGSNTGDGYPVVLMSPHAAGRNAYGDGQGRERQDSACELSEGTEDENHHQNGNHHNQNDDNEHQDDNNSDLVSLDSDILIATYENGRRYHKFMQGRYPFPNDMFEQERELLLHYLFHRLLRGKLYTAALLDLPGVILDLGTGVGRWSMCMGWLFQLARITGIDLSPIQDTLIPPNVDFVIDDIEGRWIEEPDSVDFIFCRNMAMSIRDWSQLFEQSHQALSPGGWLEVQDLNWTLISDDSSMPSGWPPAILMDLVRDGLYALGIDMRAPENYAARAEAAGFETVERASHRVPLGTWPRSRQHKDTGRLVRDIFLCGLQGMALGPLTRGLGWPVERVEMLLVEVRRGLRDRSVHACISFHTMTCQKRPETIESIEA